jgi:hypothetical protein
MIFTRERLFCAVNGVSQRPDLGGNIRHGDPNTVCPYLWRYPQHRDRLADLGGAVQWLTGGPHPGLDAYQVFLGGGQQLIR